jgi:hypothetical protein
MMLETGTSGFTFFGNLGGYPLTPTAIVLIILGCLAVSATFMCTFFLTIMIGEINRKRAAGSLISYSAYTPSKVLRVFREYRSLYPSGKLHICALIMYVADVLGLIMVAVWLSI